MRLNFIISLLLHLFFAKSAVGYNHKIIAFRNSLRLFSRHVSSVSILNSKLSKLLSDSSISASERQFKSKEMISSAKFFNCVNAITLAFQCSKCNIDIDPILPAEFILRVLEDSKVVLSPDHIGSLLYSYKALVKSVDTEKLVKITSEKIYHCDSTFSHKNVAFSLYGLNSLSCNTDSTKELLRLLWKKCQNCTDDLEAREIGMALYGLRNLNLCEETENILNYIAIKIDSSDEDFNSQVLGNSLQGSEKMKTKSIIMYILKAKFLIKRTIKKNS